MFIFQNIANKFVSLFSLQFPWLTTLWQKPTPDTMRWENVKEARSDESPKLEIGRMFAGFMITLIFGVVVGALCSWAGIAKILAFVPLLGLMLSMWGRFIEKDAYSTLIGESCAIVGNVWGLGALVSIFLI